MKRSRKNTGKRRNGSRRQIELKDPNPVVVPRRDVRLPRSPNYPFRRSWQLSFSYTGNLGWAGSGNPDFQVNFALSVSNVNLGGSATYGPNTPNYSELVNLFDEYRIKHVTLVLDWSSNTYDGATPTYSAPIIYYAVDFNDSGSAIVTDLLQYPTVKRHSFYENGYKPLIIDFEPRPLVDVAGSGLSTGYGPALYAPWIRTAEATIPHYGIKIAASNFGLTTAAVLGYVNLTAFIDVECRNPK